MNNQQPSTPVKANLEIWPVCPECGEEFHMLELPETGKTEQRTIYCESWECEGETEVVIPAIWIKPVA